MRIAKHEARLHRRKKPEIDYTTRRRQERGMTQTSFLTGYVLSLGLIVAIGAQNAFVLRQGLRREHVLAVVAFCAGADMALMAAGVAGLGAGVAKMPWLETALAGLGAAYLAAAGLGAARRALASEQLLAASDGAGARLGAVLLRLAGFTFLNPHVYLDTVALVGSVGAAQPEGARLGFVLGASLASLSWFAALGFGARLLAPVFARPVAWRLFDLFVAAVMLSLAAGLVRHALIGAGVWPL